MQRRSGGEVTLLYRLHDRRVLGEAMMVGRADAGPRRGDAPTRPPGGRHSACRRARVEARCAMRSAIARCSRLSQFSYCRQVSALRAPATQRFISSMSSEVACSAASRASSGSTASLARMTSAGLVAAAIAATDESSAIGRAPMKVPFPTCRQSSPWRSMIASALRRSPRETPSNSASSRSGGRRVDGGSALWASQARSWVSALCPRSPFASASGASRNGAERLCIASTNLAPVLDQSARMF